MKTPKEKAEEIYRKYRGFCTDTESENHISAKQCAVLELEGRIEQVEKMALYWDIRSGTWHRDELAEIEEIRSEIEKL